MTVILKSDVMATNSLGNINGINTTQDWAAYLDFEDELYTTKINGVTKSDYVLTDLVSVSRPTVSGKPLSGNPITVSKSGEVSTISSESQIRTARLNNNRFGVLVEDTNFNYFLGSATPVTQTISLAASVYDIIVSVEGTGSVTVEGDVIGSGQVVKSDAPHLFKRSSTTTATNLTITVTGSLSHAQVEVATGTPTASSRITTLAEGASRIREIMSLRDDFLNSLISSRSAFTIAIQVVDYNPAIANNGLGRGGTSNVISFEGGANKVLAVKGTLASQAIYAQTFNYVGTDRTFTEITATPLAPRFTPTTLAISVTDTKTQSAVDGGAAKELATAVGFNADSIELGAGFDSPIGINGLRGIITKLVIYNRVMTRDELTELSKSWA